MKTSWAYYLELTPSTPSSNYFKLDSTLKKYGVSLVPIQIEHLVREAKSLENIHIFIMIDNSLKLKVYKRKVEKYIKLLKSREGFHFMTLSSFEEIHEDRFQRGEKHLTSYLPINLNEYAQEMSELIHFDQSSVNKWPGASRRVYPRGEKF